MLTTNNRRLKKRYVIGGSGVLDSILKFLIKTFTSLGNKALASTAAKEVSKAALDAGKALLWRLVKNL